MAPLGDLVKVSELPEAPTNIRHDEALFDIPIMPLGDWMEGDSQRRCRRRLAASAHASGRTGARAEPGERRSPRPWPPTAARRRRRGGGGRDRQGSEEVVTATPSETFGEGDFQMNVTFRKRE